SSDKTLLITGSSDSSIIIWNDVTAEEREATAVKDENQMISEQNLLNFLQKKKWSNALKLSIRLDQPFRTLTIMKEILLEPNGAHEINEILLRLREDQLLSLLDYSIVWNTNSKHYICAQCVLKAIVHKIPPKELLKTPELKAKLEKLMPYNDRHMSRLNRLQQSVTFVDYVWETIKLPDMSAISGKVNAMTIGGDDEEEFSDNKVIALTDDSDEEICSET
ncbi:unnamed protein product, partial [Oppiella nova]